MRDRNHIPTLSDRGRRLVEGQILPEYLRAHFDRVDEPDYIPLCVAENHLMWDLLEPWLHGPRPVPATTLAYDAMIGKLDFRERLARFLERRVTGRRFPPEHIAVLAGAGSVLEVLFHAVADPGDGVLVPTPSYAGFWMDLETRNDLRIVPVPRRAEDDFRLTPGLFDEALANAGRPVRALLLTQPDNPLGTVPSAGELEPVLAWAESRGLHVISDEVYALSVFGDRPFTSCARLRPSLGDRLHLVWAFSKDFAASGLRCGVLVSANEAVLQAVDALAYWSCCSGDTQHLLGRMIDDDDWVDRYAGAVRQRLGAAHAAVSERLRHHGIPHRPAAAGFFVLLDLRELLAEPTWAAEDRLWRALLEGGVNLTPGRALRASEPGFARLCFAGLPTHRVLEGIDRIGARLR